MTPPTRIPALALTLSILVGTVPSATAASLLPPSRTVVGASAEQQSTLEDALSAFDDAGLELPALVIEFSDSTELCQGNAGYHWGGLLRTTLSPPAGLPSVTGLRYMSSMSSPTHGTAAASPTTHASVFSTTGASNVGRTLIANGVTVPAREQPAPSPTPSGGTRPPTTPTSSSTFAATKYSPATHYPTRTSSPAPRTTGQAAFLAHGRPIDTTRFRIGEASSSRTSPFRNAIFDWVDGA